ALGDRGIISNYRKPAREVADRVFVAPLEDRADHLRAEIDVTVDHLFPVAGERRAHAGSFRHEPRAHAETPAGLDEIAFLGERRVARHRDLAHADGVEPLDQSETRVPVELVADAVVALGERAVDEADPLAHPRARRDRG